MYFKSLYILACIIAISLPMLAKELSLTKQLEFNFVNQEKNVVGILEGYNTKRYQIKAKSNQVLHVNMKSEGTYFNVYSPYKTKDDDALFVGKSQGNDFKGILSKDGLYIIQVYLKTDEAEKDVRRIFEIHIELI
jgi:hypothetical protein